MGDLLLHFAICSLYPNHRIVISTEAAHAFVSSAVEKSASPPKLSEAIHSIAFTAAAIYFSRFQPKNRMSSPLPSRKSAN
jgi:hypothetical protein